MSEYIRQAILSGILETFEMTLFASLFSYLIGMPLGVILYATSRGRLLENRVVNAVIGFIVNVTRSLPHSRIDRASYGRCYSDRRTNGRVIFK